MANEDSRDNSVVGSALKVAATAGVLYGVYRGGRGIIKHYDDLGSTFLGEAGSKASEGISKTLKRFNKEDGTNTIKQGLDKLQNSILEADFSSNSKKLQSLGGEGLDDIHDAFKNASTAKDKRGVLNDMKKMKKDLKEGADKMPIELEEIKITADEYDAVANNADSANDTSTTRKIDDSFLRSMKKVDNELPTEAEIARMNILKEYGDSWNSDETILNAIDQNSPVSDWMIKRMGSSPKSAVASSAPIVELNSGTGKLFAHNGKVEPIDTMEGLAQIKSIKSDVAAEHYYHSGRIGLNSSYPNINDYRRKGKGGLEGDSIASAMGRAGLTKPELADKIDSGKVIPTHLYSH